MYLERTCEQKPLNNLGEKGAWAYPETAKFFEYSLSQEQEKLRTSNLARTFRGYMRTQAP